MNKNKSAPYIDSLIQSCQALPEIKHRVCVEKLLSVFRLLCKLEKQGDDEYRSIWITTERSKIEDFGDYNDYLEAGEVNSKEDFEDLWKYYYPDEIKWYNFAVTKYTDVYYFYFDSKLTFQFKEDDISESIYDFQTKLIDWLLTIVDQTINRIQENVEEYNKYININLPHKKRTGRILRRDFWAIFPEDMEDFKAHNTPEVLEILKKVEVQSRVKSFKLLSAMNSGYFYRVCEIGYDANEYFKESKRSLTAKEKYYSMADGRDCGLKMLDENSDEEFLKWYETEMNCGGHPWEICRGGNSTHISLFICRDENGWYFRLEGSSRARVIETITMAVCFLKKEIPFILGKAEEIYRMVKGDDYIGIVPETVVPRYCNNYFPKKDKVIDFMNLGTEKVNEIVEKSFWYTLPEIKLMK